MMKRRVALLLALILVLASCVLTGCGDKATNNDNDVYQYYKYLSDSEYAMCKNIVTAVDDYLDNKIPFDESAEILQSEGSKLEYLNNSFLDGNGNARPDLSEEETKKALCIMPIYISYLGIYGHYVIELDDTDPYIEPEYLIPSRNEIAKMLGMAER